MTTTAQGLPISPAARWLGRLWILLAAVLWSLGGVFAKAPTFADWPDEHRGILLAFWRALFAGLLLIPFVRRLGWQARFVPMALSFAAMNALYLSAMSLTTAANAIWLQSTAPLWVFLFGAWLAIEPLDRRDLVTLAFAVVGVGLILSRELAGQALAGIGCGLGAGVAYALVVIFLRQLRAQDGAWLVAFNHLAAAVLLCPLALRLRVWPTAGQLAVLSAFGMLQMAIPYLLFARGLRTVSGQEAAGLALLEPLLVPVWVYLAWGEAPAWWTLVGGLSILLGLVLRYRLRAAS